MSKVAIYGYGYLGKIVLNLLHKYNIKLAYIIDDSEDLDEKSGAELIPWERVPKDKLKNITVLVTIGDRKINKIISDKLKKYTTRVESIISEGYALDWLSSREHKYIPLIEKDAVHQDIELGLKREALEYNFVKHKTGTSSILIYIDGCGEVSDNYLFKTLFPYIQDKFLCHILRIKYFGVQNRPSKGANIKLNDEAMYWIEKIYAISPSMYNRSVEKLFNLLRERQIVKLDSRICFRATYGKGEYESFGLMPALDHLKLLPKIIKCHNLKNPSIYLFGSSYGGYIACLMSKLAPNTFDAIISNSGFVELDNKAQSYIFRPQLYYYHGVLIQVLMDNPWQLENELGSNYLSFGKKKIRSLLEGGHYIKSKTKYYIFHSRYDELVEYKAVKRWTNILIEKGMEVYFKTIDRKNLDGKVFKTLSHGMGASLKGIFDLFIKKYIQNNQLMPNDYQLNSEFFFETGTENYVIRFQQDDVEMEIVQND